MPTKAKKIVKTATTTPAATEQAVDNRFAIKGRVKTLHSSILFPEGGGLRLVLNLANLVGKTDGALYSVLDRKWRQVKTEVRGSYANKTGAYKLGTIACNTAVQSDCWVLSILGQDEKLNTNVEAVAKCLKEVRKIAKEEKGSVHISTLLTDAIPELTDLVNSELVNQGVAVSYYEEPAV